MYIKTEYLNYFKSFRVIRKHILIFLLYQCLCFIFNPSELYGNSPGIGIPKGFLVSVEELHMIRDLANLGTEPHYTNVREFMAYINDLMEDSKEWPELSGEVVIIVAEGSSSNPVQLSDKGAKLAYGTAIAWHLTGEEKYAARSRELILDLTDTYGYRNIDMEEFHWGAQGILNLARGGTPYMYAADLLESWEGWSAEDKLAYQVWLRDIQYPKVASASRTRKNNWGVAGSFSAAAIAYYLMDHPEWELEEIYPVPQKMSPQEAFNSHNAFQLGRQSTSIEWKMNAKEFLWGILPNGAIPEEIRRGEDPIDGDYLPSFGPGTTYTMTYIEHLTAHAEFLRRRGDNSIYDNVAEDGSESLLQAYCFVINNLCGSHCFTVERRNALYIAYNYYKHPALLESLQQCGPSNISGQRMALYGRLTHPLIISPYIPPDDTVIIVQPDIGNQRGALNRAVVAAVHPDKTIFELKRGGIYLLTGPVKNPCSPLKIRAEEGTGPRPVLMLAANENVTADNLFITTKNLALKGLHIMGRDASGKISNRQIYVTGEGIRIVIDNCYFDYSNQAFVRLTAGNNSVFITNSILRNSVRTENPDNGRIIDTRGYSADSLVIENSTIYNCGSSIINFMGAFVKYVKLNHNTVYQTNYLYNISLSRTLNAEITNNIFYNFAYRANNTLHSPLFSADSIFSVGEYTDADRYFNLSNNNWYNDPVIGNILDEYGQEGLVRYESWDTQKQYPVYYRWVLRTDVFASQSIPDTSVNGKPPVLLKFIENNQADTSNIFHEKLVFINAPPLNTDYWTFYVDNNFEIGELDPPNPFADEDPGVSGDVTTGRFDFSFNDDSRSATAATGGIPLGDLRWTPYATMSSNDPGTLTFSNVRAYPNPFITDVTFEINVLTNATVGIKIYDMTGKEIFAVTENINAGSNTILVNFNNDINSGIYLYQVQIVSNGTLKPILTGKLMNL